MDKNVKPVILPRKGALANTFVMIISQDIPEHVNKKGNLVAAFVNEMEFETETKYEVTNENLASWAMEKIVVWCGKSRLGREKSLKLSQPVTVKFTINGKEVTDRMKFSLSPDRIEGRTKDFASLIRLLFRKQTEIHKANSQTTIRFIAEIKESLLLTGKIEAPKLKQPVEIQEVIEVATEDFLENGE